MLNKKLVSAFNLIFSDTKAGNISQKIIDHLWQILPDQYIFNIRKGKTIISQGQSLDYIYVLLKGEGIVLNNIDWNINNAIDEVYAIDCLGITEYLTDKTEYTGFVVSKTECLILRVPIDEFHEMIQTDAAICFSVLKVLAKVATHAMEHAETHSVFPKKDLVGYYLYLKSNGKIPYICPLKRSELADHLHINLRSLYRYLDEMNAEGSIRLQKGKIVIDNNSFKMLSQKYQHLIL